MQMNDIASTKSSEGEDEDDIRSLSGDGGDTFHSSASCREADDPLRSENERGSGDGVEAIPLESDLTSHSWAASEGSQRHDTTIRAVPQGDLTRPTQAEQRHSSCETQRDKRTAKARKPEGMKKCPSGRGKPKADDDPGPGVRQETTPFKTPGQDGVEVNKAEELLEAKRASNRQNAARARKRARIHVHDMQQTVYKMAAEIANLKTDNANLTNQIQSLTQENEATSRAQASFLGPSSQRFIAPVSVFYGQSQPARSQQQSSYDLLMTLRRQHQEQESTGWLLQEHPRFMGQPQPWMNVSHSRETSSTSSAQLRRGNNASSPPNFGSLLQLLNQPHQVSNLQAQLEYDHLRIQQTQQEQLQQQIPQQMVRNNAPKTTSTWLAEVLSKKFYEQRTKD